MIIIGAKGFAKEVFEIVYKNDPSHTIVFYDDVIINNNAKLFEQYNVLHSLDQAKSYFEQYGSSFTIGIGKPILRHKLVEKFTQIGGNLVSTISSFAQIGSMEVTIGVGTNVLDGATISNSVTIGKGCIIYYNVIITHDCIIGDFVEISPAAVVLGRCTIGSFTSIGANATILPDVQIGQNVIIGAGAVVTKDIPDNCVVYGNPAKVMRNLEPLKF
jgi:sugar O-acyltransferase (sialic acid O-acetyltransferase NeuD family)